MYSANGHTYPLFPMLAVFKSSNKLWITAQSDHVSVRFQTQGNWLRYLFNIPMQTWPPDSPSSPQSLSELSGPGAKLPLPKRLFSVQSRHFCFLSLYISLSACTCSFFLFSFFLVRSSLSIASTYTPEVLYKLLKCIVVYGFISVVGLVSRQNTKTSWCL
jgi:ABC-type phosphate/phosphonate transport system permease subunit